MKKRLPFRWGKHSPSDSVEVDRDALQGRRWYKADVKENG